MLKGQLLAMKFNIGCFGIEESEGEEFEGKTLAQIVAEADDLLRADPEPPREVLEEMKDLLDYINNLHYIKYCSSGPTYSSATTEPLSIESLLQKSAEANLFSLLDEESSDGDTSEDLFSEIPEGEVIPPEDTSEETVTPPQDGVNLIGDEGSGEEETPPESTGEPAEEPTEEPPVEEPTNEEPTTEEPVTEEPSTEEPSTEETPVEEPSTEEPPAEETPPAEEPPVEEPPPTEEEPPPAEEPPVEEEPPAEEPPAQEPPPEEPPAPEPPPET